MRGSNGRIPIRADSSPIVAETSWYGLDQQGVIADAFELRLMLGKGGGLLSIRPDR
jgi:hypothetical protein